ncbi:MAG: polysaccharide biosynthesis tyrosine autokinase, partial [Cyclobacteriaceae bacterium]|nr:polysaccharide biosynthesis tyrosine autokinase [Cyclobacteriaceae bacterium]
VSFYIVGRVVTTEVYNLLPVKVAYTNLEQQSSSPSFRFKVLDENTYSLASAASRDSPQANFHFGKPAVIDKVSILIEKKPEGVLAPYKGLEYVMQIRPSSVVTQEYVNRLSVKWAEKGAGVMNLSIIGANTQKEIDFINAVIENYQEYDLNKKNQTADRTVEFIKNQLVSISDSLRLFEGQLQQFKKNNRTTGDLSIDAQRVYSKIESLEVQRAELIVKGNYYVYLDNYLKESKNLDQIILPSSMGINDPVIASLLSKIVDLQLEIKLYIEKERPTNPLITNKINRLTDKIKSDFLNRQINDAEKQMGYLPLAQRQYISIQRNYSLLENLYIYLMQKKSEAEISKAANVSDLIIVNPPMQLGGAITPRISQNYIIGTLFGIAIPLFIFIFIEFANTKVQSKEDIEKFTSIPFIGGIGHKKGEINLEVLRSPKSSISESFRGLRSNLNYFTGNNEKAVFMITSSISGEGKTFTSINLASVFSLSGKRTLIVGADLRKPKLFRDFEVSNDVGLSSFLAGLASFESVVQKTKYTNLDLVSGGPVPPNPAELLLHKNMTQFMMQAKAAYDYVIIDTPPMAIVTDAYALSSYADHIIFLVRQNYTPKELLRSIEDSFASGKVKNISIVFNDIYKSGLGYGYGYSYGYTYSYNYKYGLKGNKDGYGYYSES